MNGKDEERNEETQVGHDYQMSGPVVIGETSSKEKRPDLKLWGDAVDDVSDVTPVVNGTNYGYKFNPDAEKRASDYDYLNGTIRSIANDTPQTDDDDLISVSRQIQGPKGINVGKEMALSLQGKSNARTRIRRSPLWEMGTNSRGFSGIITLAAIGAIGFIAILLLLFKV